jgi:hypothetical protein
MPYGLEGSNLFFSSYKVVGQSTEHLKRQIRNLEHKEQLRPPVHVPVQCQSYIVNVIAIYIPAGAFFFFISPLEKLDSWRPTAAVIIN